VHIYFKIIKTIPVRSWKKIQFFLKNFYFPEHTTVEQKNLDRYAGTMISDGSLAGMQWPCGFCMVQVKIK